MSLKRLLISLVIIGGVGIVAVNLSSAFFSDTETSTGNTFQAGPFDLLIDNTSYYNGELNDGTTWILDDLDGHLFFDFQDIKPGDEGEDTVSIHINNNDAWACFDIELTKDDDNECTSNELVDDPQCDAVQDDLWDGELGTQVEFIFWVDDGDNVFESNESPLTQGTASEVLGGFKGALADTDENNVGGTPPEPLSGGVDYFIGKAWCFGTLGTSPVTAGQGVDPTVASGITCDGSNLDNSAQTDVLMGDISFYAEQHRNNPGFQCPKACNQEEVWADSVEASSQGLRKDDTSVLANRSITSNTLGSPEGLVNPPEWYTVGFGGTITIKFAGPVGNGAGPDISIHEVTGGRATYPEETATVEVSDDNITYYVIGTASSEPGGGGDGITYHDISNDPFAPDEILYVRITDTTDEGPHSSNADGFDLDAVDAVYGDCPNNG